MFPGNKNNDKNKALSIPDTTSLNNNVANLVYADASRVRDILVSNKLCIYNHQEKLDKEEFIKEYTSSKKFSLKNSGLKYLAAITDMKRGAISKQYPPVFDREDKIRNLVNILSSKDKRSAILVGEAGVGRTAIVKHFAMMLVAQDIPEHLKNATLISISLNKLLAGTNSPRDVEKKIIAILDVCKKAPNPIVFFGKIHNLEELQGTLDTYLEEGKIRFIGTAKHNEYNRAIEKNSEIEEKFQPITIDEPSNETTLNILDKVRPIYEEYHKVSIPSSLLDKIVTLSKYLEGSMPNKAIAVLDAACAIAKIKGNSEVILEDIDKAIADSGNVPTSIIGGNEQNVLKNLKREMESVVFGQSEAIDKVNRAVIVARAGMRDENKPIASILFTGGTGIGKTHVPKTLAKILGIKLIRYDMSEFQEKHTISRLIGSPPGYVGYEDGNGIVDAIRKNPFSVLLLDEMEKAHPNIHKIFLQVMDEATLTNGHGKVADFRNVIIIMTSNIGSSKNGTGNLGFCNQSSNAKNGRSQNVKKIFPSELINRFDEIINFNDLSREAICSIATSAISKIDLKLKSKDVFLEITDEAFEWFLENGYDEIFGARPMERLIQTTINDVVAPELIFGVLTEGGQVVVDLVDGEILITCQPKEKEVEEIIEPVPEKRNFLQKLSTSGKG